MNRPSTKKEKKLQPEFKYSKKEVLFFTLLSIVIGMAVPVLIIEVLLHFAPVRQYHGIYPVNEASPVKRFLPDRTLQWSNDWKFSLSNKVHINNYGFINNHDYDEKSDAPLLSVIGDSYVEALQVPYDQTMHGRLANQVAPNGRVYSFGLSGAPLSQYLVWAQYARDAFKPSGFVFVIISNDFDESLFKYKSGGGFHYFMKENNEYKLVRTDYLPSFKGRTLLRLGRISKLTSYLFFNLKIIENWKMLRQGTHPFFSNDKQYVANVSSHVTPERLQDSLVVSDLFLDRLLEATGVDVSSILFVVDGLRPPMYDPKSLEEAMNSFWATVRMDFISKAKERGFEVIDMHPVFLEDFRNNKKRFEFVTDAHWNEYGHQVVADMIQQTTCFSNVFH